MKKRLLITMTALMLVAVTMMAVPAKPGLKKKVTLKDGTTVELSLRGDEHFSFYTDTEGQPCQVVNGRLKMMTQEEVTEIWTANKNQRMKQAGLDVLKRAARRAGTPSNATTGNHRGLVILMEFPDKKFVTKNLQKTYERFFNEEGYNEGGMAGSVRDFFKKQSYDKLTIDFDVVGPYTTSQKMAYYGKHSISNGEEKNDTLPQAMIAEAVDSAYKHGVNFSQYDWDGDKKVEEVFVIFAGYAEAQDAAPETIWPHMWGLYGKYAKNYNGVDIVTYACAAELMGNDNPDSPSYNPDKAMDGIGTACHEFSHCLGLPDMYDTKGNNFGMSYWDVMDQGSYNDDSRTPAGYTSYERWFSGWLTPTEIKETKRVTDMKPIATNKEAYVLYNDKNKDEYYLLENRQPVGFDAKLPGHGLLILHVDYNGDAWRDNTVNADANHQRVTIIPADNELTSGRVGLAGDPWPGTTMNTMLGRYTTPAATLYNENTDGTKLMSKLIDDISENTETQTVSFAVGRTEMIPPSSEETTVQASKNSFTITWPEVSGATGYEVELKTVGRSPDNVEEALIYKADFSKCYTNESVDITSTLKQYGLSGWQGQELYTSPKGFMIGSSGYAFSKQLTVPESNNVTVVVGADKVDNDVDYQIMLYYWPDANSDDYSTGVSYNYTVTKDSKQVFHFTNINAYSFCFLIYPFQPMYLNYWAIYDGIWTAEQLGISSSSAAPRRASTTDIYETKTNSKTFDNMDADKLYIYRIRAKGPDNAYSGWTAEQTFDFKTTGIQSISTKVNTDNTVRYFDLQGREVNGATKGLLIRKQGNNVTKVMVK